MSMGSTNVPNIDGYLHLTFAEAHALHHAVNLMIALCVEAENVDDLDKLDDFRKSANISSSKELQATMQCSKTTWPEDLPQVLLKKLTEAQRDMTARAFGKEGAT